MDIQETALFFKTLGDPNRLHILKLVAQQEDICACTLLDELDVSQPTLSHHMKLLRDCGLVHARKSGRWMHYTLNHERFAQARDFLAPFCDEDPMA